MTVLSDTGDIKKIRRQLGLTQTQLARAACVSQSLIAKIEANRIEPAYNKAKRIFDALDVLARHSDAKASEVMNKQIISVTPEQNIKTIIKQMKHYGISQVPVIRAGQPIGLVTETILLDNMTKGDVSDLTVSDIMADCPPVIAENATVDAVFGLLRHFPIVLVSDKGKLKGVITKSDVLNYLPHRASAASARTARLGLE